MGGWRDVRTDGWMHAWLMDERNRGWMDGWMGERMMVKWLNAHKLVEGAVAGEDASRLNNVNNWTVFLELIALLDLCVSSLRTRSSLMTFASVPGADASPSRHRRCRVNVADSKPLDRDYRVADCRPLDRDSCI